MISVTILIKNGEKYLYEVLSSLKAFPEILVYDTGSQDNTLAIAKKFPNTKIHHAPFTGFGPDHNRAAALASHPWILSIDADEILSPELAQEILTLSCEEQNLYFLKRKNFFAKKWIRFCGWHPERVPRLYHRDRTAFSENLVHERLLEQGLKKVLLKNYLHHYPYDSVADFLTKMQRYSELFAKQYQGKKKATPLTAIAHGFFAFFKSYFLKKGFLDGYEGLLISFYNGHTAFYKYMKLYEANKKTIYS